MPPERRGTIYAGMVHSTDWRVTFASLAGVAPDNSGPFPLDGHDVWEAVMAGRDSPRNEVIHQILKPGTVK